MAGTSFYILVESSTAGMALYTALRAQGCKVRISPVPRGLQACCGVSLLVNPEDMPAVRAALELPGFPPHEGVVELENQSDPTRDRYC